MSNQLNHPGSARLIEQAKFKLEHKKPEDIAKRLEEMSNKGLLHQKMRDYETAFILLQRYINSIEWIKTKKEFKTNRIFSDVYMPEATITKVRLALNSVIEELNANIPEAEGATESITNSDDLQSIEKSKLLRDLENTKPKETAKKLPQLSNKGFLYREVEKYKAASTELQNYLTSVEWLKTTKEFKSNQSSFMQYMPETTVMKVRAVLEEVQGILAAPNTTDPNSPINARLANNKSHSIDKTMELVLNLPETPTDEPVNGEQDEFITCHQLYKHFSQGRFLIIDIRPTEDYVCSKIISKKLVNIPASEIRTGIIAAKFVTYLRQVRPDEAGIYERRGKKFVDIVILLDWSTNRGSLTNDNPLNVLRKILTSWDHGMDVATVVILDGGYSEWLNVYPNLVTNHKVIPPDDTANEILEDWQYPDNLSDDDIPTKPQTRANNQSHVLKATSPINVSKAQVPSNRNISSYMEDTEINTTGDLTHILQRVKSLEILESGRRMPPKAPSVDRSSKPTRVSTNPQSKQFLEHLSHLNRIVTDQEKLERQLQEYAAGGNNLLQNNKELDHEECEQRVNALRLTLQNIVDEKAKVKQALEALKRDGMEMSKSDIAEKNKLELRLGDVESRIATLLLERKSQQKIQQSLTSALKQNNNLIYKEPLKEDGPSTNSGLKRSLSSPNLVQVKKPKTRIQAQDRQVPQIDRSSKPLDVQKNRENNNNITPITSRDPSKRMDAVFRNGHPGITGLKNLGNSCYMNSILQCLSNTAFLSKYFIENSYSDDLNTDSANETRGQIAEEYAQVIKALWRGQYKCITPRDLKNTIGQYRVEFDNCDQQDSHEFLTFFLDWMHNDLKHPVKIRRDAPLTAAEKEWDRALENQTSIISHLFIGQLRSSICCLTCNTRSITYETFNSLSISLPDPNRCTLDECLRHFLNGQKISDWACPKCNKPRDAMKKFDFVKLAPIMVIHLNRFGGTGFGFEKRNTHVTFPINDLNLKPYLARDSDSTHTINNSHEYNYNLYALSNHYGNMGGGHYTAFCKSATLNKWYEYNDHTVTEIDESHVRGQNRNAYLLFYSSLRCDYTYI